jgi:hypothetical protein
MSDIQRLGDVQKCPACGSQVDPGAYHCPKCRRDFCFHCRVGLVDEDDQFHCINQACNYHGKVLCGTCDPEAKRDEAPSVYSEYDSGWWPFLLVAGLLVGVVSYFFVWDFWLAAGIGLITAAVAAFLLHRAGVNVMGKENRIVQPRVTIYHTCISCKQPVKELR